MTPPGPCCPAPQHNPGAGTAPQPLSAPRPGAGPELPLLSSPRHGLHRSPGLTGGGGRAPRDGKNCMTAVGNNTLDVGTTLYTCDM